MPVDPGLRDRLLNDLDSSRGVLHATAVWAAPDGARVTIRPNQWAPESPTDRWVLDAVRAWAEVVVTTGANLRAEPELEIAVRDLALKGWRNEQLGRVQRPARVVLTRGADLPVDHAVVTAPGPVLIATRPEAVERVRDAVPAAEVVADTRMGVRKVVELLNRRAWSRISIEAGPSSSWELYEAPTMVHHLLLSTFWGTLDPRARADALDVRAVRLEERWCSELREPSGRWTVALYDVR